MNNHPYTLHDLQASSGQRFVLLDGCSSVSVNLSPQSPGWSRILHLRIMEVMFFTAGGSFHLWRNISQTSRHTGGTRAKIQVWLQSKNSVTWASCQLTSLWDDLKVSDRGDKKAFEGNTDSFPELELPLSSHFHMEMQQRCLLLWIPKGSRHFYLRYNGIIFRCKLSFSDTALFLHSSRWRSWINVPNSISYIRNVN